MECSLTGNPLVKTYILKMPMIHAILISDQLRDWTDSVIECETENMEIGRTELSKNHWYVHNGVSLKVSFNTCHHKYDTELEFVDGVLKGCEYYSSIMLAE
ncbi:uncharacterized protein METZ01_LOCUS236639 [marine metagenome]|uniref:Uncharacterized protein n=1 Tax=marine metagenome TaxID=408172 RepID=A0A382H9I7_9ZZZZ